MSPPSRLRYPLMALAMIAMLAATWGGLLRIGWNWPLLQSALPIAHGPLMVSGFLGTLIGVERAVALRNRWAYIGPVMSGLGALTLILGFPGPIGPVLLTLASLAMVIVFMVIVRRVRAIYTVVMALGAMTWLIGNGLWTFGWPVYHVVMWWAGFLILTIAGERLELGRLVNLPFAARLLFLASAGLFMAGLIVLIPSHQLGMRVTGAGLIALAAWLFRYDIARHTIRKPGLPRYVAICLLAGYAWLVVAGSLGLVYGSLVAGPRYDALLHAIFLGFVFSMIFGHAPIIFPTIVGRQVFFHPVFYLHLSLLHISLIARVGGDLGFIMTARLWAGLFNGLALLLFLGTIAFMLARTGRESRPYEDAGGLTVLAGLSQTPENR